MHTLYAKAVSILKKLGIVAKDAEPTVAEVNKHVSQWVLGCSRVVVDIEHHIHEFIAAHTKNTPVEAANEPDKPIPEPIKPTEKPNKEDNKANQQGGTNDFQKKEDTTKK